MSKMYIDFTYLYGAEFWFFLAVVGLWMTREFYLRFLPVAVGADGITSFVLRPGLRISKRQFMPWTEVTEIERRRYSTMLFPVGYYGPSTYAYILHGKDRDLHVDHGLKDMRGFLDVLNEHAAALNIPLVACDIRTLERRKRYNEIVATVRDQHEQERQLRELRNRGFREPLARL